MQAFLDYVVKGVVDHPEQVTITPVERGGLTVYELRLHPEDVGKVIGKQGAMINAIRALLQAGAARKGLRCAVEIVEDEPAAPESGA
ncbi:MAG: KH domain-containing protein [Verrucomicrobiae bacterium]|nr:KH domain-containing protein [Verrucomicrobiae bacterium]